MNAVVKSVFHKVRRTWSQDLFTKLDKILGYLVTHRVTRTITTCTGLACIWPTEEQKYCTEI